MSRRPLRSLAGLFRLAVVVCAASSLERRIRGGVSGDLEARALWMQEMSRRLLRVVAGKVVVKGTAPEGGMLVANHLGYVDVLALGSVMPAVFVAKSDVRAWPVFGALAQQAGTVFVQREKRTDVARCIEEMEEVLREGRRLVVFPEGTSSGGRSVLPFHTPLFEAALRSCCTLTPVAIRYMMPGGDPSTEIAYWGDMHFAPHLWNLLGHHGFTVSLEFGEALRPAEKSRAETAAKLRSWILQRLEERN